MILEEEKHFIDSFKEKLNSDQQLSKEDLLAMCTQFEDTIELASVSMKIINRLRVNYLSIQASK
ncbi:MAG: hypothetical protein ABJG41_12285 [Cyclobacteriaceae bacterium]